MAGQRPRQGWIYVINPYRVSLCCRHGHQYFYELAEPEVVIPLSKSQVTVDPPFAPLTKGGWGDAFGTACSLRYVALLYQNGITCKHLNCNLTINSSRVFRGTHPYIIWTSDQFQDENHYIQTFTVIPLTSQTTFSGLSTAYPITKTKRNGLDKTSYALVHQICTVDGNCFKDNQGNWLPRIGQLSKDDKTEIEETLAYFLNINKEPKQDWLRDNASPELVKIIFDYLPEEKKQDALDNLLDE